VLEYLLTLLVTAAVTYLLTPLVRRGAIVARAMQPPRDRDVHTVPIPRLGGLAMYGGLAAGLMVADQLNPLRNVLVGDRMASGLLLAGGLIVLVGVVDDRWGLSPISKLAGQAAAGGILVWSGAQLGWLPLPGGGTLLLDTNQSTVLTIFLVVATINAVNFIDGLDGLAAGITCIAAIAFFVYCYHLTQVVHPSLSQQAGPALVSAVLVGACLGFLPHNTYPARIIMGDTGSMLLGLLLAYIPISSIVSLNPYSLHSAANRFPEILPLLLPVTVLVIPYSDLLLAVVRRTRAGKSPLAPDRKHLHHRLLDIGHSHRSSVLIMYLWAALFSVAIVWLSIARTRLFVLAVTTLAAVLVLLLMSMPRLRWWDRGRRARAAARAGVGSHAVAGAVAGTARHVAGDPVPAVAAPGAGGAASAPAGRGAGSHGASGPVPVAGSHGAGSHLRGGAGPAAQPPVLSETNGQGTAAPAVVGGQARFPDAGPQPAADAGTLAPWGAAARPR
jgi:UDP-GlcNAc:undecaprenyl-phosphate/decaprenyl-phosphate GlcNAc-1-phosphate transferase